MTVRQLVKACLPPPLTAHLQRWSGRTLRFSGRPGNWTEALKMSSGYDDRDILERVTQATRAVVSGAARYERDSVLFDEPEYPFALLYALWRAAALGGGKLDVVDFGGSLGSSYRQCRPLMKGLSELQWQVVEQPSFAAAGQREFSTDELTFVDAMDKIGPAQAQRVVLAAGVLQYIPDPCAVLDAFASSGAMHLIIDRAPLSLEPEDHLRIQITPKQIYPASYPSWVFSKRKLMERLSEHWHLVCEFPCAEGSTRTDDGIDFDFRGLVLERKW